MTITHSVQQEFLDDESKSLICIPCRTSAGRAVGRESTDDAITSGRKAPVLAMTTAQGKPFTPGDSQARKGERWTEDEHERFLLGMEMFKAGPWKKIAGVVGTRDARQTMSHAQKYRQKIKRRKQGMQDRAADCTATTKKRRTTTAAAGRVATSKQQGHVSSTVQLPREDEDAELSVTTSAATRSAHDTGLIPPETVRDRNGQVVGAGIELDDSRQNDASLEPLDILVDVSVIRDSWFGPDELWGFLRR
ncbi:hypothetical protein PHYBOEH_009620 [Phytophthora boehmeriae]|uniref:HTH myb-type domain-containing protein n=1 Tax=Phytophthora boehmeriae TaxID=109152 RepID=A0A8T1X6I0_9STRA|nr:hypothetical protein PHYBOEH_009620 [Phytophthora boehmeriae]